MIAMKEYIGTKPNPRRINKNWVFFSNGKLYEQSIVDYAIKHGVEATLFVDKDNKIVEEKKVEILEEEPIVKKTTKKVVKKFKKRKE